MKTLPIIETNNEFLKLKKPVNANNKNNNIGKLIIIKMKSLNKPKQTKREETKF